MTHARRLGLFLCTLLGACSWRQNGSALVYKPAPLLRMRTQTPVLSDSVRAHLWLGDMVRIVRGCELSTDSLPQVPVKLRSLCANAEYPQSDP